jgi:predicted amidohydrolase
MAFKAGYYQFHPRFGKIKNNLVTIISALNDTIADLIVLPELALTGYYFRDRDEVMELAENPYRSSHVESLIALCKEKSFYLVTGFAEKADDRCFNSSLLLGPEGIVSIYRKIHLFNEEKKWFDPGDTPIEVHTIKDVKIGMMICFDWIFPEVSRILSLQGADILCHPSNLVLNYCQSAMITRCLENHVFSITCNRFGHDKRSHGEIKFTGKSQIVAPKGELIYRSPSQREELIVVDIDPEIAREKMITPANDIMKERRTEFYSNLIQK